MRCSRSTSVERSRSVAALASRAVRSLVAVASSSHALAGGGRFAGRALAFRDLVLHAHEIGLRGGAQIVGFGERPLEAGDLAAQRLDFGLGLERRRRLRAQLVQLEPQLGKPPVALLELATQLAIDFGFRLRLGLADGGAPAARSVSISASRSLSSRRTVVQTFLVVLDL